ncbi:DUF1194 domain-containing protein [Celeribacter sp.]|uniref:DUF1194 domain-containing protein n=1 Tax=Celeribacter sp. TaxID=1890673 RepID=UPI003A90912C
MIRLSPLARLGSALLVAAGLLAPAERAAADSCRQALALGLDVSGSVGAEEWQLQIEGLAQALDDPSVRKAFFALEGAPVHLMVFEWAGDSAPRDLVTWRAITTPRDLEDVTTQLRAQTRTPHALGTAMGQAMLYGAQKLSEIKNCWSYTLDISADGPSNVGPRPQDVRDMPALGQITVNGLAVARTVSLADPDAAARDLAQLHRYFHGAVIRGFGAFVEQATSYSDYPNAMRRKLLKELETLAIGQLDNVLCAE